MFHLVFEICCTNHLLVSLKWLWQRCIGTSTNTKLKLFATIAMVWKRHISDVGRRLGSRFDFMPRIKKCNNSQWKQDSCWTALLLTVFETCNHSKIFHQKVLGYSVKIFPYIFGPWKRKFLVDIDLLIMEPLLLRSNTIPSLTATSDFILNNCFWGKNHVGQDVW